MDCKVCGRVIRNEEANFCDYCGTRISEAAVPQQLMNSGAGSAAQPNARTVQEERPRSFMERLFGDMVADEQERPMTTWNWLLIMLLPFVPYIGALLYLVLLFLWSFGATTATKKAWARAMLLYLLILVVLAATLFGDTFSQMLADPTQLLGGTV